MKKYIIGIICLLPLISCNDDIPKSVRNYRTASPIYPDYIDVTIPSTIAPLNFSYLVPCGRECITTFSCGEGNFSVRGRKVKIDPAKWNMLLSAAAGSDISVHSSLLDTTWTLHVSRDEIDYGLNYRLIEPGYEASSKMGIYERDLSTFTQTPVIENTEFDGCCNCHSHCKGDPSNMSMHIRWAHGCTLIIKDGVLNAYNTRTDSTISACAYTGWHPDGKYICYSQNLTHQGFYCGDERILDVFDRDGDVTIYDIERNEMIFSDLLMNKNYIESFPSFSPDGKYLYFSRLDATYDNDPDRKAEDVKYSLYRVTFDAQNGKVGDSLELLINCKDIAQSVCLPKPSPDGKYILYVRSDCGIFPVFHPEAELYLYNIVTKEDRRLTEVNSPEAESCHAWSTNGRWFVFGSRKDDGMFTRAYIAHFDPDTGRCGKPFMLPQEDPETYYSSLFYSYNIPEFVTGPALFDHVDIENKIASKERINFNYRKN